MFTSVLTSTSSGLLLVQVICCFLTAVLCGTLIAWSYQKMSQPSRPFVLTVAVLPAVVMMVILMVNGNLGVGVAVAGSFSLVRFRSMPGKASDIGVIFLAMGVGLACGMGYLSFAAVMAVLCVGAAFVLEKMPVFRGPGTRRYLTIQIPEDLNYADAFQDLFDKYTDRAKLISVKTVHLGMLYELNYEVDLKDVQMEQPFINELRVRNGNLMIRSSLSGPLAAEL
jgi:hypothetical protein